jgi:hypothetical protein
MPRLSRRSKIICSICFGSLIIVFAVNILYSFWGYRLIESLYHGEISGPLKLVISGQHEYPLEYYFEIGNEFIIGLNIFSGLFLLGFLIVFFEN